MAIKLIDENGTPVTMAQATQMIERALDKADDGEQVINGVILVQDENGNPIDVTKDNQVITKKNYNNFMASRYIDLSVNNGTRSTLSYSLNGSPCYLSFSQTYPNTTQSNFSKVELPDGVKYIKCYINTYIHDRLPYAESLFLKKGDNEESDILIFNKDTGNYGTYGTFTDITSVIDVSGTTSLSFIFKSEVNNASNQVEFINITIEIIQ